jgi:hypothetical protein
MRRLQMMSRKLPATPKVPSKLGQAGIKVNAHGYRRILMSWRCCEIICGTFRKSPELSGFYAGISIVTPCGKA